MYSGSRFNRETVIQRQKSLAVSRKKFIDLMLPVRVNHVQKYFFGVSKIPFVLLNQGNSKFQPNVLLIFSCCCGSKGKARYSAVQANLFLSLILDTDYK